MTTTTTRSQQIYETLCDSLASGDYQAGDSLPSLRLLASEYGTSVGTVRGALSLLAHEGRIEARHGSGFYVAERPRSAVRTVLLIARTEGDLWSDFVRLFSDQLSESPDTRLILEKPPAYRQLAAFQAKIARYVEDGVDAIVFDGSAYSHLGFLRSYVERVYTLCYFDDYIAQAWPCAKVMSDFFHGGYTGARHLLDRGARRIAFIVPYTYDRDDSRDQHQTAAGCDRAAQDVGDGAICQTVLLAGNDAAASERLRELFSGDQRPDAVFGYCDFRLENVIAVMAEMGLRAPEDVKLLGYYDTPWCQFLKPELSSISVCPDEIVAEAWRLIQSLAMENHVVRPHVIGRASSI